MDPLFPELPEDLAKLSDEELAALLKEHEVAAEMIEAEDEEFTKGLDAEEVLSELTRGVEQIEAIIADQKRRVEEEKEYQAQKTTLADRRKAATASEEVEAAADEAESEGEGEGEGEAGAAAAAEGEAEAEAEAEGAEAEAEGEEPEEASATLAEEEPISEGESETKTLAASGKSKGKTKSVALRRPPSPASHREPAEVGAMLVAAAGTPALRGGTSLDRMSLAEAVKTVAKAVGRPAKSETGIEQRFLVASAEFHFPAERILTPGEPDVNAKKIQAVIPDGIPGIKGNKALTASGGLCAPLEPIYSMPNFASQARPVRDGALVSFQADRGGVNVPTSTYIADITTAISVIEEAEDALGGTFATKSCQDLTCPDYTEVAVTIIAHCREYGNLNARAWPEKIAHENDLTMAAHARTAESYLLDRIKALSLSVTQAAVGGDMNAFASLANAISKAVASIRWNLRMDPGFRFRAVLPVWIGDLLAADRALHQFKPEDARAALTARLEQYGVSVTYYWDPVAGGVPQAFAAEVAASTLDDFPDSVQYAIYPEGAFIHVDSGTLELGLVRDSTLNSTNDFQFFGETFENVARLAPLQSTRWIEQVICPNGVYPSLGTALDCSA